MNDPYEVWPATDPEAGRGVMNTAILAGAARQRPYGAIDEAVGRLSSDTATKADLDTYIAHVTARRLRGEITDEMFRMYCRAATIRYRMGLERQKR